MDYVLKEMFLTVHGSKRTYVRNKSSLNREELAEFIDNCIMFASEMGVVVAPPNKNWKL
jgi:hypothetical protein